MIPRIGAFEVSIVVQNTPILFFSKMLLGYWPNAPAVASRIKAAFDEWRGGADIKAIQEKYKTRGAVAQRERSPVKARSSRNPFAAATQSFSRRSRSLERFESTKSLTKTQASIEPRAETPKYRRPPTPPQKHNKPVFMTNPDADEWSTTLAVCS